MNFSTNYESLSSGSNLLPEGKYECIVKSAALAATKNGIPYLNIVFVIRNDVKQKYQNRYIFHSIWQKEEPTAEDNAVDGFSFKQLMVLAKATELPSGKNYDSIESLLKDFVGKVCLVEIEHQTYNDTTSERVKFCNPTKFTEIKHVFKETSTVQNKKDAFATPASASYVETSNEELSDDGCPF